jgi:hypothetical protein
MDHFFDPTSGPAELIVRKQDWMDPADGFMLGAVAAGGRITCRRMLKGKRRSETTRNLDALSGDGNG